MKEERSEEIKVMLCSCEDCNNSENYFNELRELGNNLNAKQEYYDLPNFAKALASKERLILLNSLKEKDRCVCELEAILNKSQSTISHHLRKLEKAELVRGYKRGNYTYYGLLKDRMKTFIQILNKELQI